MDPRIEDIRAAIARDGDNRAFAQKGWRPLFVADGRARLLVVGHAPGASAQQSGVAWGDKSGQNLMDWLGLDEKDFRDPGKVALIPMDFYYQGKGASGDLPPRKGFAGKWHPALLSLLPELRLRVLAGGYAQGHYLAGRAKRNLTETVRAYREYLPDFFPIPHPSPLNFRWQGRNPWFLSEAVPELRARVRDALDG